MSSTAFSLKDNFICRKTSIFEVLLKYYWSATHPFSNTFILKTGIARIANNYLKDETSTWPLFTIYFKSWGSYLATMLHSPTTARESTIGFSPLSFYEKKTLEKHFWKNCPLYWSEASPSLTLARGSPPSLACTCCPGLSPRRKHLVEHNFEGQQNYFKC